MLRNKFDKSHAEPTGGKKKLIKMCGGEAEASLGYTAMTCLQKIQPLYIMRSCNAKPVHIDTGRGGW